MTPESTFQVFNGLAPLFSMALILAPRSKWVRRYILSGVAVAFLAAGYMLVVLSHFNFQGADFMSLAGIIALLQDPWAMTAGWIHYLAFDLLAGALITHKGLNLGIQRLWLVPCQLATFMLGPVGVVLFVLIAKIHGARWTDLALNSSTEG